MIRAAYHLKGSCMHKLINIASVIVILTISLSACKDSPGKTVFKAGKNSISARDTSINRHNSYNDLFLDSNQVEQFISQQQVSDTAAESMRLFYNSRNFEFAWFNSNGLTEQAMAFRNLYDFHDSSSNKKALDRKLDQILISEDNHFAESEPSTIKTELLLSWRFINYIWNSYSTNKTREIALKQLVPSKRQDENVLAETIIDNKSIEVLARNSYYPALRKQLKRYVEIEKQGGWVAISLPNTSFKKGSSNQIISTVKKRLQQSGDYNTKDTSTIYNGELESAVKKMQASFGSKDDGIIGKAFIRQLNISATERIKQILINLERMRWMPEANDGSLIVVNIPEYILHVLEGRDAVFSMPVVVGKQGHNTVLFSGSLNHVVFNPYWNLPPNIVENEVMPAMEKNENYLAEHNMEMTGEDDGLPVIRQLPGDKNELGKVKFLFPNSFNIYFHDTPHKDLFAQSKRAFSHGCIRLSDPAKLANYLLRDQPEWNEERIDSIMKGDKEKWVAVKKPVPVLIYYYTAWANEEGVMQWREDTYGRDRIMADKLFAKPSSPIAQPIALAKK